MRTQSVFEAYKMSKISTFFREQHLLFMNLMGIKSPLHYSLQILWKYSDPDCDTEFGKSYYVHRQSAKPHCSSSQTHTNIQPCSPSLQPWEWRMLRFKVISSIQQPGALHCQCITSFCSHMHSNAHTNTLLVGIHSTHTASR